MTRYRAFEEAVSMLKRYGREVARLLNQEHEDPDMYQLYVFRRRVCRRLGKFMKCEHKKYGRLPSKEELKKVKSKLYASEMIRRNMERAGTMIKGGIMRREGGNK
jgi:hypothetical protein